MDKRELVLAEAWTSSVAAAEQRRRGAATF